MQSWKTIPDADLLWGNLKAYAASPLPFLEQNRQQFGDVYRFRFAYRYLHFLNDPELIGHVLQSNPKNYRKSIAYRKLSLLLGKGLFTSEGEFWLRQRRLSQPAFTPKQISSYGQMMLDETDRCLHEWPKGPINLASLCTQITLRIINRVLLGTDLAGSEQIVEKHLPPALQLMIKRIISVSTPPLWIPTADNQTFRASKKQMDELIHQIIRYKQEHPGPDLLSTLLAQRDDENKGMSGQQLRDEVITFFLAGHETTAIALFWAMFYLEKHPEWKSALLNEAKNWNGNPETSQLPLTQLLLKEVLRLETPVWIMARQAIGADQLGDLPIKPKASLIFSPYHLHRHPDYWENPLEFKPERFEKELTHKFQYIPFGGGPRVCIGNHFAMMEMTLVLARMLQVLGERKLSTTEHPGYEYSLTLRPAGTVWLTSY